VDVKVNGRPFAREVEPRLSLADLLRDELGLTGTHLGCEHGICGACTVLLDGAPARSCLMLAVQTAGHSVTTVEGVVESPGGARLAAAFARNFAAQCGFCTPGMLVAANAFLVASTAEVSDADVRAALSGNLCRCTGYAGIVAAVLETAGEPPR
jgi:carbon-monoxide dehydrogenase small subunit